MHLANAFNYNSIKQVHLYFKCFCSFCSNVLHLYFICFLLTGLAIAIFLQKWMDLRHLLVEVKQSRSIVGFRQSQSIVGCLLNAKMGRDMWMETELHWLENHCTDSLVFSNVYCATQDYGRSQIFHHISGKKKALPPSLPSFLKSLLGHLFPRPKNFQGTLCWLRMFISLFGTCKTYRTKCYL